MVTELEKALIAAHKDPEKQGEFYELFLNSEIFIPTWDIPEKVGTTIADGTDSISPLVLENENRKYIPIFDSEAGATIWAAGETIGLAGLKGFDVLNLFGNEFHLIFNPNSENAKEFLPEEIEWLLSLVKQHKVS